LLHAKSHVGDDVQLDLNSASSTIVYAKKAEAIIHGKTITDDLLLKMGEVAASECDPTDDNRGSAEYKRDLVKALVPRTAQEALQRPD